MNIETTELTQCQECNINTNQNNNTTCTFEAYRSKLLGCKYLNTKTSNTSQITIPCNTFTLENIIRKDLTEHTQRKKNKDNTIFINIKNWEIEEINKIICSEDHKKEIISAYLQNKKEEKNST